MNRTAFAVVAVASLAFVGCKKPIRPDDSNKSSTRSNDKISDDKPKKPAEKTPAGAKLEFHDLEFTITGMKTKGSAYADQLKYKVTLSDFPEGTQVKVGNDKEEEAKGFYTHDVDMSEAVAGMSPKDAFDYSKKVDPKLNLEITFPDGVKVSAPLPPVAVNNAIEESLKTLKNGTPVLFGNEPDQKLAAHTAVWPYVNSINNEGVFGPAKTIREIDWVVSEENLPLCPSTKKCSGYKASGEDGPGRTMDLSLQDWNVSIIERKTAKVLESKKFEGEQTCPMSAFGDVLTSTPNWDVVKAWIRTERNKP